MKNTNYIQEVCDALIQTKGAIKAFKFISPKEVVRAVRRTYKVYGREPKGNGRVEISLTIGKPNYVEREFVKQLKKKAGYSDKQIAYGMNIKFHHPKVKKLQRNGEK